MSDGISSNADFIFKVSVILLCFLSLLLFFVLLLVLWLRKIQKRVDRVCKEWIVYSKVAVDIIPPEAENLPEMKNGFSFPLVISNKRAVNCETTKSWENINRTFAYAQAHHEEDEGQPDLEGMPVAQGEDQTSEVDGSTSREAALPKVPKDTPCVKIAEDSPSVLFLSGEYPDEKHGDRRIFTTLHGHAVCEEPTPAKKEYSLVLIDADNTSPENKEDSLSKENNILETEEKSFDEKHSAHSQAVFMDKSSEKSNRSKDSHGEKPPSQGTSGVSESAECTMPRHEDDSEILIPTATEPNEKCKPKPRKRTKKRSKGQRKSRSESVVAVSNLHKLKHVENLAEDEHTERENVAQEWTFRQANEQHSEAQNGIHQNSGQGGHENLLAEHVGNLASKTGPDDPVIPHPASASAKMYVQMQRHGGVEDSYESITTLGPKKWPTESPGNTNHVKYDVDKHTRESTQDFENLNEEVYSNIDNDIDGVKDISAGARPLYDNYNDYQHDVNEEFADNSHIYANADELQQEPVMFNDNLAFENADEGPIYVNITNVLDVKY